MANKPTLDEMRLALSRVIRPPQQTNLDMAREEAERIGQHHDPHTRSLQQGYEHDWYHGGTGDVKAFDPKTLGESTGAASAKKGFFFARDPSTPPPEMLEHDPESVEFLKKLGKPIPPKKTMEGHGSATASSYAGTGGSREYKEAMRMAKAAERVGNWSEYEKYMQIAEDSEINNMNYRQDLVAKHGDARDQMYEDIKNAWYGPHNAKMFKGMSQPDYEAHDKRYKELMPYGWHINYQKPHYDVLKKELQKFGKHKQIESALKSINHYQSVHNERKLSELESGANVMPVALRYKNPMYHDFKGNSYRDQTYSDLMDEAKRKGHDALILKNTFDPGGSGTPKMVDVGVMFHPNQVRSKFAAFDPTRTHESDLLAAKGGEVLPHHQRKANKAPTQMKSALGNRGTYDLNDPDITKKGSSAMKNILRGATKTAMPQANPFDTSHFDSTIIQRAKKDFGDTSKLSDEEYQKALAERANQYRIESILSGLGFDTSGYSNLSGSSYHNKIVGTEYDPKYGWVEHDTHQVRLANHPDYHPPMAEDVKQRININHAVEPSTWENYHIAPSMTDKQVNKILSGLNIPNDPDITKKDGGGRVTHAHHLEIEERPL